MKGDATVFVVDDDPSILRAMTRALVAADWRVEAFSSAYFLLQRSRYDGLGCVVADLRMPGMDGVTLLYLVRQAAPNTVRVLLTGKADLEAATAAINEGNIFRLLNKPCPTGTLLRALEAAVEQYRLTTGAALNPSEVKPHV